MAGVNMKKFLFIITILVCLVSILFGCAKQPDITNNTDLSTEEVYTIMEEASESYPYFSVDDFGYIEINYDADKNIYKILCYPNLDTLGGDTVFYVDAADLSIISVECGE